MKAGGDRPGERGMTLLELTFLVLLLSYASYIITRFLTGTRQAVGRQEAAQYMLQDVTRSLANLGASLATCTELITGYADSTGTGMLPLRTLIASSIAAAPAAPNTAPPKPVGFSLWPTAVDESVTGEVDMSGPSGSGAVDWGDEIAYVCNLNPITFTAYYSNSGGNWSVTTPSSSTSDQAEVISVGRYQLVYDYLSYDPSSVVNGAEGLRLTEWRSQPLVNYSSLSGLTDTPTTYGNGCCPRLTAACDALSSDGYTYAFDPAAATLTANCSACFFALTPAAIGSGSPASPPATLPTGSWGYLDDYDLMMTNQSQAGVDLGRIARAGASAGGEDAAASSYSVAFNVTGTFSADSVVALQGPGGDLAVPAYAQANATSGSMGGPGFPAGFEVAVGGVPGGREAFLRLVLMAANSGTYATGSYQALSGSAEASFAPAFDF